MLADARPLFEVLRREDAVCLADAAGVVLNGDAQTEIRLDAVLDERREVEIGEGEVVACGIVLVRVKVAENVRDVNPEVATEHSAHVVETRVGDARLLEMAEHREIGRLAPLQQRPLARGMDGLHRANGLAEVNGKAAGDVDLVFLFHLQTELPSSKTRERHWRRNHSSSKPTTAMPHSSAVARMRSSHSVFMWM